MTRDTDLTREGVEALLWPATLGETVFRPDRTIAVDGVPILRAYADRNTEANGRLFAAAPRLARALLASQDEVARLTRKLDAAQKTGETFRLACNNNLALQREATARADALAERVKALERTIARVAKHINEQVEVTRAYTRDCDMTASQITTMEICTSHFLDYARELTAIKGETP